MDNSEIDFVATKAAEKIYVQVTESMTSEDVRRRELGPLQKVKDNYEKTVLSGLFSAGDRVRHAKFGAGTVQSVTGSGKDARICIRFDDGNEKQLALSIAPIIRVEDEK